MKIRAATSQDLDAVEDLLSASNLPLDGVKENFSSFVVADDRGEIAGAVGLEKFGTVALLRSAVVSPDYRGTGVGRKLVEKVLERAEEEGIEEFFSSRPQPRATSRDSALRERPDRRFRPR